MIRSVVLHFPDQILANHPVQKNKSKNRDFGIVYGKKRYAGSFRTINGDEIDYTPKACLSDRNCPKKSVKGA